MHSISFTYGTDPHHPTPDEEKAATNFFNSLSSLLPCESCRMHYEAYIAKVPVDTSTREALSKWVYTLHDDVNKRRHIEGPTFEEVKEDYNGWGNGRSGGENGLGIEGRLRKLGDPHLGRKIYKHQGNFAEQLTGLSTASTFDMVVGGVILGLMSYGAVYYYKTQHKKSKNNEKNV